MAGRKRGQDPGRSAVSLGLGRALIKLKLDQVGPGRLEKLYFLIGWDSAALMASLSVSGLSGLALSGPA